MDVARAVEDGVVAPHAALVALLAGERIDHERRSLRLPVREFDWGFGDDATLVLRFVLPRGTFATAVLHEVLADAWDAGEGGEE
jgi:tRNA pseudouridine13 synthase